ncbi:Alpha/Beta hydrolase protein [Hygrophoropsis aurantiaca]|uniref:Alpha/Beta hydrolase protein n=1 Tax=Hygrophoropsis aurantiaca TaxID=72124 RepID=A0ACB8A0X5_9AGAM|nr:Alpha/Beta hydrolase protein [Hygrophoropsis aurantiaca]
MTTNLRSAVSSVTCWGSPAATKHALLIHGLTSSSGCWFRIAQQLAVEGYFVVAPDLLGHGTAPLSTDCSSSALAAALHPLFLPSRPSFSVIVGHSLGGVVALELIHLLPRAQTTPVILLDPPLLPLDQAPAHKQTMQRMEKSCAFVVAEVTTNIPTVDGLLSTNPGWSREDVVWKVLAAQLCDSATVEAIFRQNHPWSFVHLLEQDLSNVSLSIIGADPAITQPSFLADTAKPFPHIRTSIAKGASHSIHREFPDLVVASALDAVSAASM